MSAWKIVCIVLIFIVIFTIDVCVAVHFANKKEAYRESLLADWSTEKKAQINLIYYYLETPEMFKNQITGLSSEDLEWYVENEVILKKVHDSKEHTLMLVFAAIAMILVIAFLLFLGYLADF